MKKRIAFVTGAGRGIGAACAEGLAAAGRVVAVGDLDAETGQQTAKRIEAAGGQSLFVPLDVTDGASVDAAVQTVTDELGPIDILVNNVGWDDFKPFLVTDEDFWHKVVEINYLGNLRVTRAVAPGMVERGWGRVVSDMCRGWPRVALTNMNTSC